MEQYNVSGMSCAACSARVEKAVSAVPGVTSCSVSLLTNSMGVEGTADAQSIIKAVEDAGYGASPKGAETRAAAPDADELADHETPKLLRRLAFSVGFLLVLMYFSMGHGMWGWPLPKFFDNNHVAMGLTQLLLAVTVMVINQKFFINGFKGLLHRAPNMDTLVALGSSASFVYSVYALYAMTDAQLRGGAAAAMPWMHEFYFESAAMILALITVGKTLEARSKGKTTDALRGLMKIAPKTATLLRNGQEKTVPIEQVKKGDVFVVRPGESIPVDKAEGDRVSAATFNREGYLRCEATRVGEDTTLSQIIRMVSDAAATKAPIAKIADRVSGVFVPVVMAIALVTAIVWLLLGKDIGFALARGISVLVISCPCALGLATPVAIMVGNGVGAKQGVLFKTAAALEETGRIDIVALDKTGTITAGEPKLTDLLPAEGVAEEELLRLAASLESRSEHPLARAVLQGAEERKIPTDAVEDFHALPGNGLRAVLDGKTLLGGSRRYMEKQLRLPDDAGKQADTLAAEGKTPLFFALNGRFLGILAVADVIKPDSARAVQELKKLGIKVVMLTGDNARTAAAIGRQAGVDQVIAGVLPDGKESAIRKLQEYGKVAMVGDGINDAPALTRADMGIAIGAGADIAIDAADVVLMHSNLLDVPAAIRLSRATLRNIHENLFWAFFYNAVCIPVAAGCFVWAGLTLNPMLGAAAMSLSSFCVVSNALRLNLFNMHDGSHDRPRKGSISEIEIPIENKEETAMTRTLKIEGMMCPHCEARVKKTLEALDGVEEAVVSHVSGTAVVTGDADFETMKAAVEAQDYKVLGIE